MRQIYIFILLFLFICFDKTYSFTSEYRKIDNEIYDIYADFNGKCVFKYYMYIHGIAASPFEPVYTLVPAIPDSNTRVDTINFNGTSLLNILTMEVPKTQGPSVLSMVITDNSLNSVLEIPYSCEVMPIPIINRFGVETTEYVRYLYYEIENKEKNVKKINYLLNSSLVYLGSTDQVLGQSNVITLYFNNLQLTEELNLPLQVFFPNGYNTTLNFKIPFKQDKTKLLSVQVPPVAINSIPITLSTRYYPYGYLAVRNTFNILLIKAVYGSRKYPIFKGMLIPSVLGDNTFDVSGYTNGFYLKYANFTTDIQMESINIVTGNKFISSQTDTLNGLGSNLIQVRFERYNATLNNLAIEFAVETKKFFLYSWSYNADGTYGIVSGTYDSANYVSNLIVSSYSKGYTFYYNAGSLVQSTLTPSVVDNLAPRLVDFKLIPLPTGNNEYVIVRFTIEDDISGFKMIYYPNDYGILPLITSQHLAEGNKLYGTYEMLYKNQYLFIKEFNLVDFANNVVALGPRINLDPFDMYITNPSPANKNTQSKQIVYAKWSQNDVDASTVSYSVKYWFNVTNANKLSTPIVYYSIDNFNNGRFPGSWSDDLQLYEIAVRIPLRMFTQTLQYNLEFDQGSTEGSFIKSFLPESLAAGSELRVYSSDADMVGPEIIDLLQVPSGENVVIQVGQTTSFGWRMKIYDKLNGFEKGNITIWAERDHVEYSFPFVNILDYHDFMIPIENGKCVSQNYTIRDIYLVDKGGYTSNMYSAFFNYADPKYHRINVVCPPSTDVTAPTLKSFNLSPSSIDVGSNNRVVEITFDVEDTGDGINTFKTPTLYFTSDKELLKKKASLVNDNGSGVVSFSCSFELPYGFGYPDKVLVSLYGIVDRAGNFIGFSTKDLSDAGYTSFIDTTVFSTDTYPSIETTNDITFDGGKLLIIGKAFGLDNSCIVKVNYNDGNGYSDSLTPTFSSATVLTIDNVKPTNKPFNIQIDKRNGEFLSNEYLVSPLPSPIWAPPFTPPPDDDSDSSSSSQSSSSSASSTSSQSSQSSSSEGLPPKPNNPCLNNCGGPSQGNCGSTGCICISPWTGIDCTSKVIIIPTPTINNTIPSTNVTVPGSESSVLTGLISLVELQELNQSGGIVFKYPFTQWIWSNISTPLESIKYLYSTNITNQLDQSITNINVSIQYFDKEETVTFAGESLLMNQYSIKYSINITSYSFTNSLNQLQLIMKVSLESQDNKGCSSLESGNTTITNSEYVKLQVDDHSLYGRFIKRGIIDGRISSISNNVLQNYNNNNQYNNIQSYIGIGIRSYRTLVQLDPDFSVLIDQRPASDKDNSVCSSTSSKKLSSAQIAGIVIGSVGFAAVVVISVSYYFYQKRRDAQLNKSIGSKLNRM